MRKSESRTKRESAGAVIDQFVMYFDGMTYKLGGKNL